MLWETHVRITLKNQTISKKSLNQSMNQLINNLSSVCRTAQPQWNLKTKLLLNACMPKQFSKNNQNFLFCSIQLFNWTFNWTSGFRKTYCKWSFDHLSRFCSIKNTRTVHSQNSEGLTRFSGIKRWTQIFNKIQF